MADGLAPAPRISAATNSFITHVLSARRLAAKKCDAQRSAYGQVTPPIDGSLDRRRKRHIVHSGRIPALR